MSDTGAYDFEIKRVRRRYVDLAQRYALTPLTGPISKDQVDWEAANAEATLKQLDVDEKEFQRMNIPRFSRPSRNAHRHQIDEWSDEDDWDDDGDDNEENVT